MALVEIDVVHPESCKGCIELLLDLRARQALVLGRHRKEQLGGEHIAVSRNVSQQFPQHLLRGAAAIDIGCIDEIDTGVEGRVQTGAGSILLDAGSVGQPGSEGDLRDRQVAVSQSAIFHPEASRWFRL